MKVAVALLRTPDKEKVYLQRRHDHFRTNVYPEWLSFFGGKMEEGEEPHDTIKRELREELGLGEVSLEHFVSFSALPGLVHEDEPVEVHVFHGILEDDNVDLELGTGIESFSIKEALERPDLVPTTRHVLEQLVNDGSVSK